MSADKHSAADDLVLEQDEKASTGTDVDVEKLDASPTSSSFVTVNSPEERRLVRKLDSRILPIACLLYFFSCTFYLSFALTTLVC